MPVGAGAGAAAAHLHAEPVVQQPDHQVVVQVLDVEGHDRAAAIPRWSARMCSRGTVRSSRRSSRAARARAPGIRDVPIASLSRTASAALMVWRKPGVPPSSRASMSSTKLCCFQGLVQFTVPPPAGRAPGCGRAGSRRPARPATPARRGTCAARSTPRRASPAVVRRMHVDVHVRRGRGEVHEAVAAVRGASVAREGVDGRPHPGHVGAGGEGADLERTVAVSLQQLLERSRIDQAPLVRAGSPRRRPPSPATRSGWSGAPCA